MKIPRWQTLAFVLLAVGCASEQAVPVVPPPAQEPVAQAVRMLPVVAMRWEVPPGFQEDVGVREGAPVSLTSGDGEGLAITSLGATAVIEDPLAFTELHFVFKNPSPRAIEGRFEVTLPPDATISRFAMLQSTGWQEGEVVELQAARAAYEDFLHRRSDPALLEKQAGNRFQARVFPIPASGEKEIIFSYSQELTRSRDPYRLYLRGLPRLGKLDIRVLYDRHEETAGGATPAGRRSFEIHQTDFTPDHDFALPLPAGGPGLHGLRQERFAVARITPLAEAAPDPVQSLLVLFDTSASRALGFRAEVERLGKLVEALGKGAGAGMPLAVACFDQEVEVIHDGTAGDFGPKQLDAILARRALGASDLGKAVHFASTFTPRSKAKLSRVLLVSDGVVTAGETDEGELKPLFERLRRAGVERFDALVDGGIRDEALARRLAVGGLPRDGVVLDGALGTAQIAERLNQRSVSGIKVQVPGSAWVWPKVIDGVQPGDQRVIYADLPPEAPFEVELAGSMTAARRTVTTGGVERPMLERAMVSAEIRRLMDDRGASTDDAERARIKQQITELSTRYRVLSDFTGLLILETDADYERFHIDRQALADILTVGPAGVELLNRNKPAALQVAAEAPPSMDGAAAPRDKEKMRSLEHEEAKKGGNLAPTPEAAAAPPPPPPPPSPAPAPPSAPAGAPVAAAPPQAQPPQPPPPPPPSPVQSAPDAPLPPGPPVERATVQERSVSGRPGGAPAAPAAASPPPPSPSPARPSLRPVPHADAFDGSGSVVTNSTPQLREPSRRVAEVAEPEGPSPYNGRFAEVMNLLAANKPKEALDVALRWHEAEPGDVLALVALGEAYEAVGQKTTAGRAYGSIIDLFPSRADLRRFAGARLAKLGMGLDGAFDLVLDTYRQAVVERPDHPASHRYFAYALARAGRNEDAFKAIVAGARRSYPPGRFLGIERIFRDDVGILAAAWIRAQPARREEVMERLARLGVPLSTKPSLRFVLTWETDGNDVDFHILDAQGGHAFYQHRALASGGELYADVTTGYGPECFTIEGHPHAYPYRLRAHYYSRGPMGYGMGNLEIMEHDGRGGLRFDERPYVVMTDRAFVNLGSVGGPLTGK
jgi:hypothetical protein